MSTHFKILIWSLPVWISYPFQSELQDLLERCFIGRRGRWIICLYFKWIVFTKLWMIRFMLLYLNFVFPSSRYRMWSFDTNLDAVLPQDVFLSLQHGWWSTSSFDGIDASQEWKICMSFNTNAIWAFFDFFFQKIFHLSFRSIKIASRPS